MTDAELASHWPPGFKIAVSGGAAAEQTTAAELFSQEFGDRVTLVPEASSLLLQGGFPRSESPASIRAFQRAVYHVQRNMEEAHQATHPTRTLLCDRGTVDAAASWPGSVEHFFEAVGSRLEEELLRYDAVLFFECSSHTGFDLVRGNHRNLAHLEESWERNTRLRLLWSQHPRCLFVPDDSSLLKKIQTGLTLLTQLLTTISSSKPKETKIKVFFNQQLQKDRKTN